MTVPAAIPHRYRLWAIVLLTALDVAALIAGRYVAPELVEEIRALVEPALLGALAVLAPALYDAIRVERRRRRPGVPALPDDVIEDARPSRETIRPPRPSRETIRPPRPSRETIRPPGDGALGIVLLIAAAACSAVLHSGCGASALGAQADLVAFGGIAAAEADEVLVDARARELDAVLEDAREECSPAGCSEERSEHYRAELAATEARWAPVLACRAPVVEALRSWADGIETARQAATADVGLALLVRLGARFVAAYGALVSCVEAAAPDVDLPGLPPALAGLAGGAP